MTDFGFKPSEWLAIVTWIIAVFAGLPWSEHPFYSSRKSTGGAPCRSG